MSATLQHRVTAILTRPRREWPIIARETDSMRGLYTRYIVPLVAIGAVANVVRLAFFGPPLVRPGLGTLVVNAILRVAFGLASVIVAAVIVQWLAPRFKSSGNTLAAAKLVAYASTPVWLAGIFNLSITLMPLVFVAELYAVYLYYVGLPIVMGTPADHIVPFMLVSAIAVIVVGVCFSFVEATLGLSR